MNTFLHFNAFAEMNNVMIDKFVHVYLQLQYSTDLETFRDFREKWTIATVTRREEFFTKERRSEVVHEDKSV